MTTKQPVSLLEEYIARTYPAIALETWEEERIAQQLTETHFNWEEREHLVLTASAAAPLTNVRTGKALMQGGPAQFAALFAEAVKAAQSHAGNGQSVRTILILMDFQHVVNNAGAYRALINAMGPAKAAGLTILLAAPSWKLPDELKHRVPVLSVPLPGTDDLQPVAMNATEWTGIKAGEAVQKEMCRAALGLTIEEAENAFTLAASVSSKTFQIERIEREKMRLVRSQCLSVESPLPIEMFGGYGRLKAYLSEEVVPNKDDQELRVRGCR